MSALSEGLIVPPEPENVRRVNMWSVYENFVREIAGDALQAATSQESLKESVARDDCRDDLQKQINKLQAKIRKEKQLNRQMEMNAELKKLRKELEDLNG